MNLVPRAWGNASVEINRKYSVNTYYMEEIVLRNTREKILQSKAKVITMQM